MIVLNFVYFARPIVSIFCSYLPLAVAITVSHSLLGNWNNPSIRRKYKLPYLHMRYVSNQRVFVILGVILSARRLCLWKSEACRKVLRHPKSFLITFFTRDKIFQNILNIKSNLSKHILRKLHENTLNEKASLQIPITILYIVILQFTIATEPNQY